MSKVNIDAAKKALRVLLTHSPDQFWTVASADGFREAATELLADARIAEAQPMVTVASYLEQFPTTFSSTDESRIGRLAAQQYRERYGCAPDQAPTVIKGHHTTVAGYRGADVRFIVHAVDSVAGRVLR